LPGRRLAVRVRQSHNRKESQNENVLFDVH
jgi:hypothetical protein